MSEVQTEHPNDPAKEIRSLADLEQAMDELQKTISEIQQDIEDETYEHDLFNLNIIHGYILIKQAERFLEPHSIVDYSKARKRLADLVDQWAIARTQYNQRSGISVTITHKYMEKDGEYQLVDLTQPN